MIKLIIKAEQTRAPDGSLNFVLDVYTEPHEHEPHCTQIEMIAMSHIKQIVTDAIAKAGARAVKSGVADTFLEKTFDNIKRTDN